MLNEISFFKYNNVLYDIADEKARQDLAVCVNNGYYDSNAKKIILRHDSDIIIQIDATDFIKDGMVSNVQIINGYLVITFNTDAGQEPIRIPITDIFNPDNYYTKSATNGLLAFKQDVIQDLAQIRQGANAGSTAYQKPQGGIPLLDIKQNEIDNVPTNGSNNLVRSGGVQNELALGAVYDVSAKNPTAGPNSDGKWESLSALMSDANLNTLIPTAVRKGGMSIKFVQTSDNKYVQYRCTAIDFTTDVSQWQGVDIIIKENNDADFSIDDEQGNSIVLFENGDVKTKNFDSSKDASTSQRGLMSSEDKAKLDTDSVKLATIQEGAQVNDTITDNSKNDFSVEDEDNYAIIKIQGGYPETKNFNGRNIANTVGLLSISDISLYQTIVVSIADYNNNLLDVFAAISPTPTKHYVILIPEGTYDVSSWFSQEYIDASNEDSDKRGVVLADYTKILGIGSADKVIFDWTQPDGSSYHLNNISTLNTHDWNELENITVQGHNVRYAVHDDPYSFKSRHLRVKNCIFKVSNNTTRAWGGGFRQGEYDGVFENCQFIMDYYSSFASQADQRESGGLINYIEPFVLHDYATNTEKNSYLTFKNCRFITPYTNFRFYYDNNWEQVAYDSSYTQYDGNKEDYAVNDCVNMEGNTSYSYKCLVAGTQVPPYAQGRPSINTGWGATGATKTLYITLIGSKLSTFIGVSKKLTRVTGFGNIMGKEPIMNANPTDSKSVIIDII